MNLTKTHANGIFTEQTEKNNTPFNYEIGVRSKSKGEL